MSRVTLVLVVALAACERERPHVFHEPAPQTPAQVAPSAVQALEAPFGLLGAGATVVSVASTASGVPVALTDITEPIDVMTMVALGPGVWSPGADARIELRFTGASQVTLVRPLEQPTPTTIAYVFHVPTSRESAEGLRAGNYRMQLRLIMRDSVAIAVTAPVEIRVR